MSRRKGRILAFQALFSYDMGGESLDELLTLKWAEENLDQETSDFARIIIAGTINHLSDIDELKKRLEDKKAAPQSAAAKNLKHYFC